MKNLLPPCYFLTFGAPFFILNSSFLILNSYSSLFLFFQFALFFQCREIFLAQHERLCEVVLSNNRICRQFLRRTMKQDTSLEEQIGTIGDTQRILHVMVSNQNAYIQILQLPHDKLDILYGNGVHTSKRFVEHDELRLNSQTAGNLRTTALTTAELVALVLAHLLQAKLFD